MEAIRSLIEWVAQDSGSAVATLFPYGLAGIAALYVLWLVLGYLRVSQVGLGEGRSGERVLELPRAPDGALAERPRGVPYCAFDGLQFPVGARFCPVCERDLMLDCANCGATLQASDASCYRCGTRTGAGETPLLS
jgi:double zinc ribbon protein